MVVRWLGAQMRPDSTPLAEAIRTAHEANRRCRDLGAVFGLIAIRARLPVGRRVASTRVRVLELNAIAAGPDGALARATQLQG